MEPKSVIGKLRSDAGYTLTEVLVVLAIVGLLASIAVPVMTSSVQKARESALRTNLNTLRSTIDEYYADNLRYPEDLNVLVEQNYLRALPTDTIVRNENDWDLIISDEDNGISDVKSRSTDTALDGSIYADW